MKNNIKYSRIIIEGLPSIESQSILPLNNVGLNPIKECNGAGKSNIFNAILWAEFGPSLKKLVTNWEGMVLLAHFNEKS
jgi:chromosome segregation ATPase